MPTVNFLILVVFLVAFPIFLVAEYRGNARAIFPLKLICSLCFVAVGLTGLVFDAPDRQSGFGELLFCGLIFSLVGDMVLVWKDNKRAFPFGLASFLIAQVLYAVAFSLLNGLSTWDVLLFLFLAGWPLAAYRYLNLDLGKMKIPVLFYLLVISAMLTKALSGIYLRDLVGASWMIPLGALLFYISDAVLALVLFQRNSPKPLRGVNLITYYIGQMLLAFSLLYK